MNKKQLLEYWLRHLALSGLQNSVQQEYKDYIVPLIDNEVPIIFDFNHLCKLLGRSNQYLASVVNLNNKHYRSFKIAKRNGGNREIAVPYPALLECQYWIYENILKKVKIHPTAQGFAPNKSIVTNAKIHINQNHFLKIDIKDFFPSIKINRVIGIFKDLGYSHKVSFFLSAICCINDELPQGAPTSPVISNIVCRALDIRLFALARKFTLRYTRYADDLAFSGDDIAFKFISYVEDVLMDFDFVPNPQKTSLQHQKSKRILTGISIVGEKIKIPRQYKRILKQEIYFVMTYGISSHIRKKKIRHPYYLQSLIGKVIFWLSVEPNNSYAQSSLKHLRILEKTHPSINLSIEDEHDYHQ